MTIEEIFTELISHMHKGLTLHNQLVHLYGFLNLKGYQKQQEYQYFEQSKNYIQLKQFYLQQYDKMVQEKTLQPYNLIPTNWYKYKKIQVDVSTKRTTIRDLFKQWLSWEEDTKILLNNCYQQLSNLKEFHSCEKINQLLSDVNQELSQLKEQQINLENAGYDMIFIIENQQHIYKKYKIKLKYIYGGDD